MASLPELQAHFPAALRGDPDALAREVSSGGIDAAGRVSIYRNNSLAMFEGALERTYPVLRCRVGDDYFHQLVRGYRARHPSRQRRPALDRRALPPVMSRIRETGTGYEWLAELAALEWACETALGGTTGAGLSARRRSRDCRPDQLGATGISPPASRQRIASSFPVLDVWRANQPGD